MSHEILNTLSAILPPPSDQQNKLLESLNAVLRSAVTLSIEMRTQRAAYMMLPPLQPEYDANGDVARKVPFQAAFMNERGGAFGPTKATIDNEEWERRGSVVRLVLFPLVVKRGDESGVGNEEIVVCPAQVLVARDENDSERRGGSKGVRILSEGAASRPSVVHEEAEEDVGMGGMI